MDKNARIYIAGHRGLVGSSLVRKLQADGYTQLILRPHAELDLTRQSAVETFFAKEKIDYVFLSAARAGGILANSRQQAEFLYENLMISSNVIHAAHLSGVKKLLYLGSSCIYPKFAQQPIREDQLLSGPLESTNEGYALAKIAGLKLCEKYAQQYGDRFISAMPCNLYGPGDNFHPERSHVIPGLLRRFHEAKVSRAPSVTIWGTGTPLREFLYVEDLAEALLLLMKSYESAQTINIGAGVDCTILELAKMIQAVVGFEGEIRLDSTRPDGTPKKLLDVSRIHQLGWKAQTSLKDGLKAAYAWALSNQVFSNGANS